MVRWIPGKEKAKNEATSGSNRSLADYSIADNFIKDIKNKVTAGTSTLFLLTGDVTLDRVEAAFKDPSIELIQSNLSSEQEAVLREPFSHVDA